MEKSKLKIYQAPYIKASEMFFDIGDKNILPMIRLEGSAIIGKCMFTLETVKEIVSDLAGSESISEETLLAFVELTKSIDDKILVDLEQ